MKFALASCLLLGFAVLSPAYGQDAAADDARYRHLISELRCLVCQNQTIADSNAALALDLRNQIRAQIAAGRSDEQIRAYMVERYGDFVLYRPPFKASTVVLWLGPGLLLAGAVAAYVAIVRRRRVRAPAPPPPAGRRSEIEKLLDERP
jgi:cytochrome c-type biogenesis protein CcmH